MVKRGVVTIGAVLAVLAFSAPAAAQRAATPTPLPSFSGSAQGQLTVTATIVSSVGVIIGDDGKPRLIVANAPDPRDNPSSLVTVQLQDQTPVPQQSATVSRKSKKK